MKKWKAIISAFALALCASVTAVGFGGWIIQGGGNTQYDKYYDANAKKVAYTQDSKGVNTYFTTVESALEKTSSGTVYVIPGTNPTINTNCTVKSGVSLYLPYEDDLKTVHNVEDPGRTSEGNFSDYEDAVNNKGLCKSTLTLANNVTLTNQGTIFVGGVLGRQGLAPTGMTVGHYSQINLGTNSKIANVGEMTCYGYIKETESGKNTAKVSNSENGILNLPFAIYDFRGGSFSSYAVVQARAMPFNVFDFPNIQCDVSFTGNSFLNGTVTVYASDKINIANAPVIGPKNSSSLIRIVSGALSYRCKTPLGYLYDDFKKETKENAINRTTFTVDGEISIASMSLDVGVSIETKKFHLPFSYKFAFKLNGGYIDISNKVKFLAGCRVHIGKNAEIFVKAETVFYQNFIPPITTGKVNTECYPNYTKSAELINDGKLTISSSFGGIVHSSSENSKTITASGFSDSAKTVEAFSGKAGGLIGDKDDHVEPAKITRIDKRVFDPSSDTTMLYSYGRASSGFDIDSVEGGKIYTSHHLVDYNRFGWYADGAISSYKYGVRYVLNSNTATNPNSIASFDTDKGTSLIKPLGNTNTNLEFVGYYYASDFNVPSMLEEDSAGNYLLDPTKAVRYLGNNNFITLYGKWIDASSRVTIQFRKYNDNGSLSDTTSYVGAIGETVNISGYPDSNNTDRKSVEVANVSRIDYKFKGWIVKDSNGNIIEQTDNSFIPTLSGATYFIEPLYEQVNCLALIVKNARILTGHYAISSLKISGNAINIKNTNEHILFVAQSDTVYIETESGSWVKYTATFTVNGKTITVNNGSNKTISLSDYADEFASLKGPIRIDGAHS